MDLANVVNRLGSQGGLSMLRHRASRGLAPSPPLDVPYVGHVGRFLGRIDSMMELQRRYGDVVRFELPRNTAYLLLHPDHVERVLVDDNKLFSKQTQGYDMLRHFLGNGLVTSEGEFWRRQRRIAQPAFNKKRISEFAPSMVAAANGLCERWEDLADRGEVVDVAAEMMRVTLRIAGETLLSTDPSNDANTVGRSLSVMLHLVVSRLGNPLAPPFDWPTPANLKYRAAAAELDRVVMDIIQSRREGTESKDDLLQMLLEARDEETGEGMSDRQLRDEVMTMFLAGHETTANALSATLMLLGKYPSVARAVHDEARSVLGCRDATADDLPQLELARRVLQEAMRLYPPAWLFARRVEADMEFDGYRIDKGQLVFLAPYATHRHPKFWESPLGFDPDRWLPERARNMHRYQYFPFSAGPRMCIGAGFAMMEGQLLLATLARRFRVDLAPGAKEGFYPSITLRPKHGVLATLHRYRDHAPLQS